MTFGCALTMVGAAAKTGIIKQLIYSRFFIPSRKWLDYNIAVGYRITKRFTTGLGWNERVGITNKIGFTINERIYGPQTFFDFKIKKGFALRADIEKMNVFIPPYTIGPDFGNHQWKWGFFMGIKKQYDFIKSVKGNFQFLYNVYDDHSDSPYLARLVVRFGFEFPIKIKEKQPK